MLQDRQANKTLHFSYRCYLQYNAASHPDGFIAPADWLQLWNVQQWFLRSRQAQQKRTADSAVISMRNYAK
ncbi:MAG: hypothetical protein JEZ00_19060 [Anaerolineaceae bacterium]|nr:hypothetical protein [Anaerolineaceae bacterium]